MAPAHNEVAGVIVYTTDCCVFEVFVRVAVKLLAAVALFASPVTFALSTCVQVNSVPVGTFEPVGVTETVPPEQIVSL